MDDPTNPNDPFDPERLLERASESVSEDEQQHLEEVRAKLSAPENGPRVQKLQRLIKMTTALNAQQTVDGLLEQILVCALELADGDRAYVLQSGADGVTSWASRDKQGGPGDTEGYRSISNTILNQVLSLGKTYYSNEAMDDSDFMNRRSVRDLSLRSVACVPLKAGGSVIGALYVDGKSVSGVLDEAEVELLETFGDQAAAALDTALKRQELENAAEDLREENASLRLAIGNHSQFDQIRGQSKAMREVFAVLERVTHNPVTVLINGETGTGKELVARALHYNGPRREKNFVAVNCAAFTESLLESQLFGFRKGSFTGADRDRAGLVEEADGGTLFLDEIAEMSLDLQSKFLRVIEEREVQRLGDAQVRKVDVRFVAATHRDLKQMMEEGKFREDLFYRINVVTVELPPLRDRRDDIDLLAEHFLKQQRERLSRPGLRLGGAARAQLQTHDWPGNVRELRNRIERACALSGENILTPQDLGLESPASAPTMPQVSSGSLEDAVRLAEKMRVESALNSHKGVVTHAAKELGVTRQHLHNLIKKLGINLASFKS